MALGQERKKAIHDFENYNNAIPMAVLNCCYRCNVTPG